MSDRDNTRSDGGASTGGCSGYGKHKNKQGVITLYS